MNGTRARVGNPYQFDWEEEESLSVLSLPQRFFSEVQGFEIVRLPVLEEKGSRVTLPRPSHMHQATPSPPWDGAIKDYVVSTAWLAFYAVASVAAAAISLYLFAHGDYLFLPASILGFFGFMILALITQH